ncbi:MAG: hypothetical protein P1U56_05135 [Saprospiraceae bacterium]|nr:hypothetical protein [Saprospiraceae bacterium]
MKKIVLFIAFIMGGMLAQAQSTQLERAQAKEMDALVKIITFEHKNLTFNKNQEAKLERIFFKKSTEVIALRNKEDVSKSDYMNEYLRIQNKYEPMIEAVLSPAQKIAFRKNSKKKIKKLKD